MGEETNLVYQDFGDSKGGSDSARKLDAIRLPNLQGKRFLDLGCNAGFFCAHARSEGASYTLGVDNSPRVIGMAKERYPDMDFLDTGWDVFPEGNFDVAICLSAIHYAKDPCRLAQNIREALNPGGVFVLEGGLYGAGISLFSDVRIPVWREVGDKCFHLSENYVLHHMLRGFDITLTAKSINQGGDPLDRYVVHATPAHEATPRPTAHRLDIQEYAAGIALSAHTIVDQQPGSAYVRLFQSNDINSGLRAIFDDSALLEIFVKELKEALGTHAQTLEVRWTEDGHGYEAFAQCAGKADIEVQLVS